MSRKGSTPLRAAIALTACLAIAGVAATTGVADPAAQSAAATASSIKKALRLGNSANRKASRALTLAKRAQRDAAAAGGKAGPQGPAGPAGPVGERGPQGAAGSNGTNGTNGVNGTNGTAGATGATGSTGSTGAMGPQGSVGLWAVVEDDGIGGASIDRGSPGATAMHLGNGLYQVDFGADVTGCAYVATVGSASDQQPVPRFATVEQQQNNPEAILLRSWEVAEQPATEPAGLANLGGGNAFHVAAIC